jgi:two-component system chemotaxis response regulator CheB
VPKIRVLVVDDAVVFRRLVSDELAADPAIEVVGSAANGRIALTKLPQLNPDLVILDIEMPELDGLATLREIRKSYPKLPVIMFSALTERGASATLDALALGATDYFAKPAAGMEASLEIIRKELIPSIKEICGKSTLQQPIVSDKPADQAQTGPVNVVVIGTSTGGPNALADLVAGFPADLPVPFLIVQHMPPMFTKLLAERLTSQSALKVAEGKTGDVLRAGHAWIAPGDFHMTVTCIGNQPRISLNQDPPENSCRPAADVLFRSVAQTFGASALAVVLTGMGQDGLRGCEAIRAAGGQVIVQDEATSVVWGMPGFVARAGLANRIMPLGLIGGEIVRCVRAGRKN